MTGREDAGERGPDHHPPATSFDALLGPRPAGFAVPLFSLRTATNWGSGEILDLVPLARWAALMRQGVIQLLPINETAPHEASPYAALSAFAIDPLYLSLHAVEDLPRRDRRRPRALPRARAGGALPRAAIRDAKLAALLPAWHSFRAQHVERHTARGTRFERFVEGQRHWLDDYALFRVLKEGQGWRHWREWPAAWRRREPRALAAAAAASSERVGLFRYVQWLAHEQWAEARWHARRLGVCFKGDLPFVIGLDSADGWGHADLFVPGWEVGAPPDDFSRSGQNWGLPLYDWPRLAATGYAWWRARIRQAGALYDLFRLDHIVGFFRTYSIPLDPRRRPCFHPAAERDQMAQGEGFLRLVEEECGAAVPIAEDLGTIPDFVRAALRRHGIPGYRVLRWERRDGHFTDPRRYEARSVATTGTHDTSTLGEWWAELPSEERVRLLAALRAPRRRAAPPPRLSPAVHRLILKRMYEAGSAYAILPVQDLFGWPGRINVPMTPSADNWNYRLPFRFDANGGAPARIRKQSAAVRRVTEAAGRGG